MGYFQGGPISWGAEGMQDSGPNIASYVVSGTSERRSAPRSCLVAARRSKRQLRAGEVDGGVVFFSNPGESC